MVTSDERILITGANGLIGQIVSRSLAKFEIYRTDKTIDHDNPKLLVVNLSDPTKTLRLLETTRPQCVIHLAANPQHTASEKDIREDNFATVQNIYDAAEKTGVRKIIFASSTHIYGSYPGYPQTSPFNRLIVSTDPPKPKGWYAKSKLFGEKLAWKKYQQSGLSTLVLRIGHVTRDNRPFPPYHGLWLSQQDTAQVFNLALASPIAFGIYFVMSDNTANIFSIASTIKDLGYKPQDSADNYSPNLS